MKNILVIAADELWDNIFRKTVRNKEFYFVSGWSEAYQLAQQRKFHVYLIASTESASQVTNNVYLLRNIDPDAKIVLFSSGREGLEEVVKEHNILFVSKFEPLNKLYKTLDEL